MTVPLTAMMRPLREGSYPPVDRLTAADGRDWDADQYRKPCPRRPGRGHQRQDGTLWRNETGSYTDHLARGAEVTAIFRLKLYSCCTAMEVHRCDQNHQTTEKHQETGTVRTGGGAIAPPLTIKENIRQRERENCRHRRVPSLITLEETTDSLHS